MMSIFAICGAAVITAVMALMLRTQSPHSAMMMSVAAGVLLFLSVLKNIPDALLGIGGLLSDSGIDLSQLTILFKVTGICYLTEFTCDCVTEAGLLSLSANLSFAGKVMVLLTALPLFEQLISVIQTLSASA